MGSPCPSLPTAGGRAVPEVLKVGNLSLLLTCYSNWESGPVPCLRNTVEPDLMYLCESHPEGLEAGWVAPPLTHCWKGSTSQGRTGGLVLVVRTREIWQTDQCCNYPDTEPGLWVDQHYLWYAGEREGTDSIDPKLQDLNGETTGYPTGIPFRVHHPQCRKYQKP